MDEQDREAWLAGMGSFVADLAVEEQQVRERQARLAAEQAQKDAERRATETQTRRWDARARHAEERRRLIHDLTLDCAVKKPRTITCSCGWTITAAAHMGARELEAYANESGWYKPYGQAWRCRECVTPNLASRPCNPDVPVENYKRLIDALFGRKSA